MRLGWLVMGVRSHVGALEGGRRKSNAIHEPARGDNECQPPMVRAAVEAVSSLQASQLVCLLRR